MKDLSQHQKVSPFKNADNNLSAKFKKNVENSVEGISVDPDEVAHFE